MIAFNRHPTFTAAALLALAACGGSGAGSRAPILGLGSGTTALSPAVTSVDPSMGATGVPITQTTILAAFNEAIAPVTAGATFTLTTTAPSGNPAGTVTLDPSNRIASFTLAPGTTLAPLTVYTATISGVHGLVAGLPMLAPYTWTFTTGATPATGAPTVTAVTPVDQATGVPLNATLINAAFSEPMAPLTGGASFTLTAPAPAGNPAGTVTLEPGNRIATFTLAGPLAPLTLYTATLTGAQSLGTGLALAQPYQWHFTTGATLNTTRPRVTLTAPATTPPGPTPTAPANAAIIAVFSEEMAPATLNTGSFTLTCPLPGLAPAGLVTYAVGTRTALFTPLAALVPGTTYTATLTTAATDLAGNALAGNQAPLPAASNDVWSFIAAAPVAPAGISVLSTNPAALALDVNPSTAINATFQVPSGLRLNPSTVHSATFTLTGPAPALTAIIAASVLLDTATGTIATFTPLAPLAPGSYSATLASGAHGVTDLAIPANGMAQDFTWTFTVGAALPPPVIALGSIASFGSFGGSAGITNTGLKTVINGDIGTTAASTLVTGFHDAGIGDTYTETPLNVGIVNGKIYTAAPPPTAGSTDEGNASTQAIAMQGQIDAQTAYNALALMPIGPYSAPANLGGITLFPGVYPAPGGSFMIEGGDLTLDAQGDGNAVWVFQMASSLTVGGPGAAFPQSVILINGAQAGHVFWQVGSAATINAAGGGTMVGTLITRAGAAFSTYGNTTIVTLNGRAVSLGASVTLVDTIINVPAL